MWAIVLVALVLRLVGLSEYPAGLNADEASFGYDAYSILQTGRDQWGNFLPISLKSFGDYKLPLYGYLAVPSVAIFGLNEFSVRLPNAVVGTLAALATYLLTRETSKKESVGVLAALLLAVSPWHIPMSRGAFEANLTTFLLPATLYFYIKGRTDSRFYLVSALFFALNMFSYHTLRLVLPVLMGAVVFFSRKSLTLTKNTYVALSIGVLATAASIALLLGDSGARVGTSSILGEVESVFTSRLPAQVSGEPEIVSKLFNNKATFLAESAFRNYVTYFSPQFLFTDGPAEATYGMMPAVQIALALGGVYLFGLLRNYLKRDTLLFAYLVVLIGSFSFFAEDYFFQQPIKGGEAMFYGMREAVGKLEVSRDKYQRAIVSKSISEPHIYVAFYTRLDPAVIQQYSQNWDFEALGLSWVDQLPSYELAGYTFEHIDWQKHKDFRDTLLVGRSDEFPDDKFVVDSVKGLTGEDIYWLVDPSPEAFANLNE